MRSTMYFHLHYILQFRIHISCQIVNGGNDHFIAKNVSVPPNSAIELIQGGAKIVLANGDVLKAQSDTASSLDIVTSSDLTTPSEIT